METDKMNDFKSPRSSMTLHSHPVSSHGSVPPWSERQPSNQEGLYIRYLRVGDVAIDVSTAGFSIINLDRFQAVVKPYLCRNVVLDWKRLVWSLEMHFVSNLIRHTANNKLSKLFRLQKESKTATIRSALPVVNPVDASRPDAASPSSMEHKEEDEDEQEEDVEVSQRKRDLLLGTKATTRPTSTISLLIGHRISHLTTNSGTHDLGQDGPLK